MPDRAGQGYHDHKEVPTMAFERISIDHEKMGGLPCIPVTWSMPPRRSRSVSCRWQFGSEVPS